MPRLLGIDLGTSSVKAVVIDERGHVLGIGMHEVPIQRPHPGWAEQNPHAWWDATIFSVRQAVHQAGTRAIHAIGLSGQMHGTVLINRAYQPIGPAIIWADQRSSAEADTITALIGTEQLVHVAGTGLATGFMATTLYWFLRHDPVQLDQAMACLLPKDYLRLCLTGDVATDASDASSTALFDIRQRQWSRSILDALGLPAYLLPPVLESADIAGQLRSEAAEALGIAAGIPVVAGCADQAAQAVGNGLIEQGQGSVTIGTGGQLLVPLTTPHPDPQLRVHVFCHAPADRWYMLGAMLAAGLSLRWFRDLLGLADQPEAYDQLTALAATVEVGAGGLLFLPYLIGERTPVMDSYARGSLVGLTLHHGRGHMVRAIMEGVAFALRQILETMRTLDVPIERLVASGNGLASPVWRQIVADVLAQPLHLSLGRERAGVGAALVAGIGSGVYGSYVEACTMTAMPVEVTEPIPAHVDRYTEQYNRFVRMYPLLKPLLHDLSRAP